MGETYKISCKCGYEKELNSGGGLASCNIDMVSRVFSEEKLKEFNMHYKNKEVQGFLIENETFLCNRCKEIMTIAVLKVQLINDKKLVIINDCPICSAETQKINNLLICPKCGNEMIKEQTGHWD